MTEIGKVLKDARVQKGLTLDDLQQSTKIQKRYLIAIETEDFDQLPGEFYVRAFVRQYAEAVDLDADALLAELAPAMPEDGEEVAQQVKRTQAKEDQQNATKLEKLYGYLPTIIIVIVVVGILGSIWAVAWANHKKNANTQIETSSSSVKVSSDVSSSSKKKASSTEKVKASIKKTQKITYKSSSGTTYYYTLKNGATKNKITLKATSSSWNAVYANGTQKWQGTLTAGSSRTVTVPSNTTTIKLTLGNASGTTVKINGKKFNFKTQSSSATTQTIVITVK